MQNREKPYVSVKMLTNGSATRRRKTRTSLLEVHSDSDLMFKNIDKWLCISCFMVHVKGSNLEDVFIV